MLEHSWNCRLCNCKLCGIGGDSWNIHGMYCKRKSFCNLYSLGYLSCSLAIKQCVNNTFAVTIPTTEK